MSDNELSGESRLSVLIPTITRRVSIADRIIDPNAGLKKNCARKLAAYSSNPPGLTVDW